MYGGEDCRTPWGLHHGLSLMLKAWITQHPLGTEVSTCALLVVAHLQPTVSGWHVSDCFVALTHVLLGFLYWLNLLVSLWGVWGVHCYPVLAATWYSPSCSLPSQWLHILLVAGDAKRLFTSFLTMSISWLWLKQNNQDTQEEERFVLVWEVSVYGQLAHPFGPVHHGGRHTMRVTQWGYWEAKRKRLESQYILKGTLHGSTSSSNWALHPELSSHSPRCHPPRTKPSTRDLCDEGKVKLKLKTVLLFPRPFGEVSSQIVACF